MFALILETLSSTELLFILVVALIFFGPRKLPQLARSMGKGLAEFRKASDDFKRTWEREVAIEAAKFDIENENKILPAEQPQTFAAETVAPEPLVEPANPELVVARGSSPEPLSTSTEPLSPVTEPAKPEAIRKQDWL